MKHGIIRICIVNVSQKELLYYLDFLSLDINAAQAGAERL